MSFPFLFLPVGSLFCTNQKVRSRSHAQKMHDFLLPHKTLNIYQKTPKGSLHFLQKIMRPLIKAEYSVSCGIFIIPYFLKFVNGFIKKWAPAAAAAGACVFSE